MYKYLSIGKNLQEMMIMLKSLPACSFVLNKKMEQVDINQIGIESVENR